MTRAQTLTLPFAAALILGCNSKASLHQDAGVGGGMGTGGTISSGLGGNTTPGTGGSGTGGGAGMMGTGGTSARASTGGTGGGLRDAGGTDTAKDLLASSDGGDDASILECEPGYPLGSSRPMSDGCNSCTCMPNGKWMCSTHVCPPIDAGVDSSSAACSTATTQADCEARNDCHAVFVDPGTCECAAPGCCTRFSYCAKGAKADCTEPTAFSCTIMAPFCEDPYVLAYAGGCYEGCVLETQCAQ